jgi:hypothetical protein
MRTLPSQMGAARHRPPASRLPKVQKPLLGAAAKGTAKEGLKVSKMPALCVGRANPRDSVVMQFDS